MVINMSELLRELKRCINEHKQNIYSIAEYRTDAGIAFEEIQISNACNDIYSISKVFTMTAIGMLFDRGLLRTDETVADILADELPGCYHENWKKTTVDMLLRHRVGIPGGALDIDALDASAFDCDYLKEVVTLPWDIEPGEAFRYTDAAFYLLSRIAAKRAGEPMQNYLWKNLFRPLGFCEMAWSTCPAGHAMGATGLYIRTDDMVKLGAVYLQKGMYGGERILSQTWVEMAFARTYELFPIGDTGAYQKGGMGGQALLLLPERGIAVGWIGHRRENEHDLTRCVFSHLGIL